MTSAPITVTIESVVDQSFIDCCLGPGSDQLFRSDTIGYWARGVMFDLERKAWLVWEDDEKCRHGEEPDLAKALRCFERIENIRYKTGCLALDLSKWHVLTLAVVKRASKWHVLTLAVVKRAWLEGVRLFGEKWFDNADGSTIDTVLQRALLGKVRYG